MDARQIQQALVTIGWPIKVDGDFGFYSRAAVRDFQHGWSFDFISPDGDPGAITQDRLNQCLANGLKCGPHFQYKEFACKTTGWIMTNRLLVIGLERIRELTGPIGIINGYRDPEHNRQVGGKANSIHLYGGAADIHGPDERTVRSVKMFSGIGIAYEGFVAHVDVRNQDGIPTFTGANTPDSPATWRYNQAGQTG